jgi:hypothetical protein
MIYTHVVGDPYVGLPSPANNLTITQHDKEMSPTGETVQPESTDLEHSLHVKEPPIDRGSWWKRLLKNAAVFCGILNI